VKGNKRVALSLRGAPPPSAEPDVDVVVSCRRVEKAFGSHKVLDGASCDLPRGEVTVIMGPSGTGKSVLLHHIVGLLLPDRGDVIVNGYSVPKLDERELLGLRRQIGMLFQDGALFSSMNLYDNVAFPLRQHTRKSERQIREIVMARLEEVGLAGAEKRTPNELSGGMRKRAGFARALVLEPNILLCDEPDSGLDPVRTALLCKLIKEVQQRHHCSAIIISHDIKSVFEIADYVVLLHRGHVVEQGTKAQMKQSRNEFTRQFLEGAVQGPLRMD
jgi:phospholipid/cholesterol/gamma-HCH transport system ATP-binding protein